MKHFLFREATAARNLRRINKVICRVAWLLSERLFVIIGPVPIALWQMLLANALREAGSSKKLAASYVVRQWRLRKSMLWASVSVTRPEGQEAENLSDHRGNVGVE